MHTRVVLLLYFQILTLMAFAQPGGGGGIRVLNILDYEGKSVLRGDTSLRFQLFAISKNGKIKFQILPDQADEHKDYNRSGTFIYIPPYIQSNGKDFVTPNQRLMLMYLNDTMTIDFIDILSENGAGSSDVVNHIYFNPGYYKCYRNPWNKFEGFSEMKDRKEILNALHNGINTNTDNLLISLGLMEHIPDPALQLKRMTRNRIKCLPDVVRAPFYRLCAGQITLQDSTLILLSDSSNDLTDTSSILYYVFYFSFDYRSVNRNAELQLASNFLKAFETYNLKINGVNFTGTVKLAVPFHNAGLSSTFSGFDLLTFSYSQGNLIEFDKKYDVDIITEQRMIRPN